MRAIAAKPLGFTAALLAATLLAAGSGTFAQDAPAEASRDKVLFDFETEADLQAWSNIDVPAVSEAEAKAAHEAAVKAAPDPSKAPAYVPPPAEPKEPPVRIEWTAEGATSGKHAMKLTFAGGHYPTVGAKLPPEDWMRFRSFHADVTASRDCIVIFRAIPAAGNHLHSGIRWEFAARLSAGLNRLTAPRTDYAENRWKAISALEIYMYNPKEGESITVDNIYLSGDRPASPSAYNEATQWPKDGFKVAGTDLVVKDIDDLGDKLKLKDAWVKPEILSVEQAEAEVRAGFEKIRKDHPKAVLAMLRQGEKGCDPVQPDKEFAGWECGYGYTHLPMSMATSNTKNAGPATQVEACLRGRPSYHRVDLSVIPEGARVLAARLIVVSAIPRNKEYGGQPWIHWETGPTLVVTEPVNRPWKELEVNSFEYAKDKFWKDFSAQSWGEDADCGAIFLSHGPGNGGANSWDFTEAVRYWTEGKHANHGFIISSQGKYMHALSIFAYRCPEMKNRPCAAVIYEPKEKP